MGYNDQFSGSNVLDIETMPIADAADYIEPAQAPSNYKEPEAIAKYVKAATEKEIARCALDPDLCQIGLIGLWPDSMSEPYALEQGSFNSEASMLEEFWKSVKGHRLIGFNLFGFDALVLMRRSQLLGVKHDDINTDKYRSPHVDLMQKLSFRGAMKFRSQRFYLKRFGIPYGSEHTGADVPNLMRDGKWDEAVTKVLADVRGLRELAERVGVVRPIEAGIF
jgi:DNA polymerase elongation subunit (family B)